MNEVIDFSPPTDSGRPKLVRARGARTTERYCAHRAQLIVDTDSELVTCSACKLVMSAYNALMVITKEWERMHYDVTEWRKMREEQNKKQKEHEVRRKIRQLQWIETPEEGDEPARSIWLRVVEACGKQPYAMFRHGRNKHVQYCILSETGGWTDAEFAIRSAKNVKSIAKC